MLVLTLLLTHSVHASSKTCTCTISQKTITIEKNQVTCVDDNGNSVNGNYDHVIFTGESTNLQTKININNTDNIELTFNNINLKTTNNGPVKIANNSVVKINIVGRNTFDCDVFFVAVGWNSSVHIFGTENSYLSAKMSGYGISAVDPMRTIELNNVVGEIISTGDLLGGSAIGASVVARGVFEEILIINSKIKVETGADYYAAIGGDGKTIKIENSVVEVAAKGINGAAIGSGIKNSNTNIGLIIINCSDVTTSCITRGAGIGASNENGVTIIVIIESKINTTGGEKAAGIGCSRGIVGKISIEKSEVLAKSEGTAIGFTETNSYIGTIDIKSSTVKAESEYKNAIGGVSASILIDCSNVETISNGNGYFGLGGTTVDLTIKGGEVQGLRSLEMEFLKAKAELMIK